MAKNGVTYKINLEVAGISQSSLQAALNKAVEGKPLKINKVEISRQNMQSALSNATKNTPLVLTHIQLGKGALQNLQTSLNKSDLSIQIKKIDASPALKQLKTQLENMLGGLGITGVRGAPGAAGVESGAGTATKQMERQAAAAKTAADVLKNAMSMLNSSSKTVSGLGDLEKQAALLQRIQELEQKHANAVAAQGDERLQAAQAVEQEVVALTSEVNLQKQAEVAAAKAAAAKARGKDATSQERDAQAAVNREIQQTNNLQAQTSNLHRQITTWIKQNPALYQQVKDKVDQILATLGQMPSDIEGHRTALSGAKADWAGILDITGQYKQQLTGFPKLLQGISNAAQFLGLASAVSLIKRAFQEMFTEVKAVDAALVEFRKVTELTAAEYDAFVGRMAGSAKDIGVGLSDILNASADFARLGFSADDASQLAKYALVYKNVGDGITDISFATESMISTMKAFGLEASQAEHIIDAFNEVGNSYAISASGIGEALQRSAAALASAGNSMEESIGLATGMNEILQNPEVVGTALKTLTMYLRAAKTEAADAGIETDGMADSVSKLRDELLSLTGVDIMTDSENFKSTYQIMKEIASVWETLSDVTRANVLNLLGGKRNANSISSLLTNFEQAEAAMNTAMNSTGSAMAENEKYLDSITGKLQVMHAAFQEISYNALNSNTTKVLLDMANAALAVVNSLSRLGTIVPLLGTMLPVLSSIRQALSLVEKEGIGFGQAFSRSFGAGSAILTGLGALITIIATVDGAIKQMRQNTIDAGNAVTDAFASAKDQYQEHTKRLQAMKGEYERLAEGVDENGNNVSLTADEYERFKTLLDQIVAISPSIIQGYDEQGKRVLNYKDAVEQATVAEKELLQAKRQQYLFGWQNVYSGVQVKASDAASEMDNALKPFEQNLGAYLDLLDKYGVAYDVDVDPEAYFDKIQVSYSDIDQAAQVVLAHTEEFFAIYDGERAKIEQSAADLAEASVTYTEAISPLAEYYAEYMRDMAWYQDIQADALPALQKLWQESTDLSQSAQWNRDNAMLIGAQFSQWFGTSQVTQLVNYTKRLQAGEDVFDEFTAALNTFKEQSVNNPVALGIADWIESLGQVPHAIQQAVGESEDELSNLTADALNFDPDKAIKHLNELQTSTEKVYATIADLGVKGAKPLKADALMSLIGEHTELLDGADVATIDGQIDLLSRLAATLSGDYYDAIIDTEDAVTLLKNNLNPNDYATMGEFEEAISSYDGMLNILAQYEQDYDKVVAKAAQQPSTQVKNFDQDATIKQLDAITESTTQAYAALHSLESEQAKPLDLKSLLGLVGEHTELLNDADIDTVEGQIDIVNQLINVLGTDYKKTANTAIKSIKSLRTALDPDDFASEQEYTKAQQRYSGMLNFFRGLKAQYDQTVKEASEATTQPSDLAANFDESQTFQQLNQIKSSAKDVYETLSELRRENAQILDYDSLYGMLGSHTGLLENADVTTLEGQIALLEQLADVLQGDYQDAVIDATTAVKELSNGLRREDFLSDTEYEQALSHYEGLLSLLQVLYNFDFSNAFRAKPDNIEGFTKGISSAVSTMWELEDGYQLTHDTLLDLLALDTRYAQAVQQDSQYLTLNREKYSAITQAIAEETKAKALHNAQLIIEDENYQKLLSNLDTLDSAQATRLSNMTAEAMGWLNIANEIDYAASAYNRFVNASEDRSGSRYTALTDAMDVINKTLYDIKDPLYKKVGREQYKAAMAYVGIDVTLDKKSIDKQVQNAKKYIGKGVTGINTFIKDLMNSGLTQGNVLREDVTAEQIAAALGLSKDAVIALVDEYNTYVSENPITLATDDDEPKSAFETLMETMDLVQQKQAELTKPMTYDTSAAVTSLQTVSSVLTEILNKIAQINGSSITITKPSGATHTVQLGGSSGASGGVMRGGKTLVGELGREIVVDPATSKWYTVGNHGAEFVTLPKNAIVFGASQTSQLLGRSSRTRGTAMPNGTSNLMTDTGVTVLNGYHLELIDDTTPTKPPVKPQETTAIHDLLEEIQTEFEEIIKFLDHRIKHWEHAYDVAEHGMNYQGMDRALDKQIELYQKKYRKLQKELRKMRKAGAKDTDEEFQKVEEEMWQIYNTINDKIDELHDLYVNGLNQKIDDIQNAYKGLADAMQQLSENGSITLDTFQALGENGLQYLAYLTDSNGQIQINEKSIRKLLAAEKERLAVETALRYIEQLRQALANNEKKVVASLVNATNKISKNSWDIVWASMATLKNAGLTNDQYNQVVQNVQYWYQLSQQVSDEVAETNDQVKGSMDDLISKVKELIRFETQQQIDAIKDQISKYKEIVDLKKESLRADKEEADYQKTISEKIAEIAKLQAQIDTLSLDNSRSAAAQRAKLEQEMAEKQDDLDEYQADHAYDTKIDALDKMAEAYEDSRQGEIDALENSISSEEKLYQAAIQRIKTGWNTLYADLIAWNTEYGSVLNSEITEAWNSATEAVRQYGSVVAALNATGNNVTTNTTNPTSTTNPTTSPTTAPTVTQPHQLTQQEADQLTKLENLIRVVQHQVLQYTNDVKQLQANKAPRDQIQTAQRRLQDAKDRLTTVTNSYRQYARSVGKTPKYHDGGVVKGNSDEIFAILKRGEMVLNEKAQEAVYKLINFPSFVASKFGASLDKLSDMLFGTVVPANRGFIGTSAGNGNAVPMAGTTIQAEFVTNISHNGTLTSADAQRYGQQIGQNALAELQKTFMRRGVSRSGTRILAT